jgi:HEAT repeat protein
MYAQSFETDVMPVLLQAAPDTNAVVREAAVNSLTLFVYDPTVSHPNRVAAARAVLQNGSAEQTWKMLNWLPQFLPEAGGTVPLLIAALSNPSERTRGKAAQTLGQIGVLARDAVPTLLQLRTDDWSNVREAATNALKAIDTSPQQGTLRSAD